MDDSSLLPENAQQPRSPRPISFTSIYDTFEQNLRDEFARRAAKDKEILGELHTLRESALEVQKSRERNTKLLQVLQAENQELKRLSGHNGRLSDSADDRDWREEYQELSTTHSKVLQGRDKFRAVLEDIRERRLEDAKTLKQRQDRDDHSSTPSKDRDWHEEYRKLSKKHGNVLLERDASRTALENLMETRRKDMESIKQWQERDDRLSRRRSSSRESMEQNPPKIKSSPSMIFNKGGVSRSAGASPLSHTELPPAIPENEPIIITIPSDPPVPNEIDSPLLFDELNLEPAFPLDQALAHKDQIFDEQEDRSPNQPSHSSPKLPPNRRKYVNIKHVQLQDGNGFDHIEERRPTPSSISTSSQSSQRNDIDNDTTLVAIPSDSPVMVSALALKRKRSRDEIRFSERAHKKSDLGNGTPGNPLRVKSDQASSSPLMNMRPASLRQNSQGLDLDDVDGGVPTPKKHRFTRDVDSADDAVPGIAFHSNLKSPKPPRASSAPAASQSQRDQYVTHNQNPFLGMALNPIDTNLQSHPRSANRKAQRYNGNYDRGAAAIPQISEDGEDYPNEYDVITNSRTSLLEAPREASEGNENTDRGAMKGMVKERLPGLLETPMPAKSVLAPIKSTNPWSTDRPTSRAQTGSSTKLKGPPMSHQLMSIGDYLERKQVGMSLIPTVTPSSARSEGQRPITRPIPHSSLASRSTNETEENNVPHTSLRTLPLDQLWAENFKINPVRNKGVSYAFTEVVRGRDERKCLPGCTRAECCGAHFRRLIESGLEVRADQNLWAPEGEDEGVRLIIEHTGWSRSRIERLGEDDWERLLIDAKIQKASNLFGKHRHLHARAPSPPGFWRTEFPSTQEQTEDRKLAYEMDREKIEARWREAMKPRGLWKFADE